MELWHHKTKAIDFETAQLIGDDFGIEVKQEVVLTKEDMLMIETEEEDKPEDLVPRPPCSCCNGSR